MADSQNDHPGSPAEPADSQAVLSQVASDVAALRELFQSRLADDTVKAEAFERLYRQLDDGRRERDVSRQRILLLEIVHVRDRVELLETALNEGPAVDAREALESIAAELDELLARRGVVPIVAPNDHFDPATQEAVSRRGDGGAIEAMRVVEVVRPGYRCGDYVLRPTQVVVEADEQFEKGEGATSE